ncbi:MAG: hypothetical protein NVS4B7_10710 [Ktedonobacteraceae bacterium]
MSTTRIPGNKPRHFFPKSLCLVATALVLLLTACSSTIQSPTSAATTASTATMPQQTNTYGIAALAGYQVSLFASGSSSYSAPDSVAVDNDHVFIDYQNSTAKDCTDKNSSTVVEYTMDGKVVKTFTIPGHSDGMRIDPSSHLVWTTSCEDGNPKMATIDPNSGTVTPYTFAKTPHGGGYDDLFFLNGKTFVAASNPTLDNNGNNPNPALDQITLSGGKAVLKPILMGNATATDTVSNMKVTLTLTDPDSLTTDSKGDLVLVSQADSELIFIKNPGTAQQSVTRTPVGTQLDDTVWATSAQGRLLITDGTSNLTLWIRAKFQPGTIYTQTPDDSGVDALVGVVDPGTGNIVPIAIGFSKPTGMIFVPDSQS